MSRHVLQCRQHAAREQPLAEGPSQRRNQFRIAAERAVADYIVRAGNLEVEDRRTGDVYAQVGQFERDQMRVCPYRAPGSIEVACGKLAESACRRRLPPVRRSEPGNRSEEHMSEIQSPMRISSDVF